MCRLARRSHEVALRREVGRIDHERVPFPPAARVAAPHREPLREMRASVQGNHARFVDGLERDGEIAGRLQDLVIAQRPCGVDVLPANPWHAIGDATHRVAEIFRSSCRWSSGCRRRRRSCQSRRPVRRHRRDPAVGRVNDERRAVVDGPFDHHRRIACPRRAGAVFIGVGEQGEKEIVSARKIAVCGDVEEPRGPPLELGHFLVGQEFTTGQFFRPLEGRRALVQPHALQVGLPVRRQRRRPLRRLTREGNREQQNR